jgi:hypothetical protein
MSYILCVIYQTSKFFKSKIITQYENGRCPDSRSQGER